MVFKWTLKEVNYINFDKANSFSTINFVLFCGCKEHLTLLFVSECVEDCVCLSMTSFFSCSLYEKKRLNCLCFKKYKTMC